MAYLKINGKVVFCLVLMSSQTRKWKTELSQKAVNSLNFSVMQYTHRYKAQIAVKLRALI